MRYGAIDIGSNSVRLLVGDLVGDDPWAAPFESVARAGEPCRLGRGLHETGRIDEELTERAAAIAHEFARRARSLGAVHVVAGATAALRSAENGAEAAERISARAGVPVRVLGGDEEARIVYKAVVLGLGGRSRSSQCVVFDLGGGSTEVVSGVGAQAGRWTSLPFGAVSIHERALPGDPPDETTIESARELIARELMHGCAQLPERSTLLAGVGGTITVLASLDRGLVDYDPALLEGWYIERGRAQALIERILRLSHEDRRRLPIMGEGRADIIGAGALVVEGLMQRFQAPGLVTSTQGLRYGLVRLAAEEWLASRSSDNR
jgi:exopolyphosphatase / guanosine-5'-triphosphate,3'-diphosphate pyrophosphatase